SNVSGNFQLKIIDIDGKLISENSFTNSTNPIKQDVSNLKDGVYFVQIITNNNCSTKKFVKF
ncbi:MAG: T9SS type A sorting domain-containing protein, partial [Bacteroidota bacterium]|nr:T9SS type A sorting domain-containing protein [Bacteroidota bacterium]